MKKKILLHLLFICSTIITINAHTDAYVKSSLEAAQCPINIIGGKAYNLAKLQKIDGSNVPGWICVTTALFNKFLDQNKIAPLISQLESVCRISPENNLEINNLCSQIQALIKNGQFENSDLFAIESTYNECFRSNIPVAIRSSGILEDSSNESFAGLYESYLNIYSFESICEKIKHVWASSFSSKIVFEKGQKEIPLSHCSIAVIIQEMVRARASGVASSTELSSNYPGIEISANYGIGETSVDGSTNLDMWLVQKDREKILKASIGSKEFRTDIPSSKQGTILLKTSQVERSKPCLSLEEVLDLSNKVKNIRESYGKEVDVEFAYDYSGALHLLQSRPLVEVSKDSVKVLDLDDAKNHSVIATADYSVPGVVHGKLKFVDNWQVLANDPQAINPNDIVFTYIAINYWSHYLSQFKGLITKQGGPTTHPILLCRERGVPCLIGIDDDFENLYQFDGQSVTLDGYERKIYAGKVKVKDANYADLMSAFNPVAIRDWKSHKERVFELNKGGYLFDLEGNFWLKQPTYPLQRLFQEIHLNRAKRLPFLIPSRTPYQLEARIINNHVCSPLDPAEDYIRAFKDMTLEECEQFCKNFETNLAEYQFLTTDFRCDSDSWIRYIELISDLKAYTWVAEIFRMYVDRQAEQLAASLSIPQFYFDECSSYLQSQIHEEDTIMQKDIFNLAIKIKNEGNFPSTMTLENAPEIFNQIIALGKKYRFTANIAIENDLELDVIIKRLADEVTQIEKGKKFLTHKLKANNINYFPTDPDLSRWIYLSIYNRILQSNSHHIVIRSQWKIRDLLLQLGEYATSIEELNAPEDIFNLSSAEINQIIIQSTKTNTYE